MNEEYQALNQENQHVKSQLEEAHQSIKQLQNKIKSLEENQPNTISNSSKKRTSDQISKKNTKRSKVSKIESPKVVPENVTQEKESTKAPVMKEIIEQQEKTKRSLPATEASPGDLFIALNKRRKLLNPSNITITAVSDTQSPVKEKRPSTKMSHLQSLFKSGALTIPKMKFNKENIQN